MASVKHTRMNVQLFKLTLQVLKIYLSACNSPFQQQLLLNEHYESVAHLSNTV